MHTVHVPILNPVTGMFYIRGLEAKMFGNTNYFPIYIFRIKMIQINRASGKVLI